MIANAGSLRDTAARGETGAMWPCVLSQRLAPGGGCERMNVVRLSAASWNGTLPMVSSCCHMKKTGTGSVSAGESARIGSAENARNPHRPLKRDCRNRGQVLVSSSRYRAVKACVPVRTVSSAGIVLLAIAKSSRSWKKQVKICYSRRAGMAGCVWPGPRLQARDPPPSVGCRLRKGRNGTGTGGGGDCRDSKPREQGNAFMSLKRAGAARLWGYCAQAPAFLVLLCAGS